MQVGLALEIDSAIYHLADAARQIDKALRAYFANKTYGADVENIFIENQRGQTRLNMLSCPRHFPGVPYGSLAPLRSGRSAAACHPAR